MKTSDALIACPAALLAFLTVCADGRFIPADWPGLGVIAQTKYVDPKTMVHYSEEDGPPTASLVTSVTGPTLFNHMLETMRCQEMSTTSSLPWKPTPVPYGHSARAISGWQSRWGHGPVIFPKPTGVQINHTPVEPTVTASPVAPREALMPPPDREDRERLGPMHLPGLAPFPTHPIDFNSDAEHSGALRHNNRLRLPQVEAEGDRPHKSYTEDRNTSATAPLTASHADSQHRRNPDPHHGPFELHPAKTTFQERPLPHSARPHPRAFCVVAREDGEGREEFGGIFFSVIVAKILVAANTFGKYWIGKISHGW